jgi:hypothetical protein
VGCSHLRWQSHSPKAGQQTGGTEHDGLRRVRDAAWLLVAAFGVTTGWLICQLDPGHDGTSLIFQRTSWFTIWSGLAALDVGLWLLLGYISAGQLVSFLRANTSRESAVRELLCLGVLYAVYFALIAYTATVLSQRVNHGHLHPLPDWTIRITLLDIAALLGSLPSAVGLWATWRRCSRLHRDHSNDGDGLLVDVDRTVQFRRMNQRNLAILATVIGTAVLQTSALRNALIGSKLMATSQYPSEFVLLYGVFFAVALAGIYLPSEWSAREAATALQSEALHLWHPRSTNRAQSPIERWLGRNDLEDRMSKALGLDTPILARIQTSLGLLAPVLAAIVSTLLPH